MTQGNTDWKAIGINAAVYAGVGLVVTIAGTLIVLNLIQPGIEKRKIAKASKGNDSKKG
ncbi:MAG: hypothetical protein H6585_10095 [Flavobacteriales bacterium]|nr:hypothetical protein [Flavobacteriales bacterium]